MPEQEYHWLCRVISAIGSSLELERVLSLAAEVAAQAAGCQVCFLYLWNPQRQKLVVTATTPGYEKYIRSVELGLGEGLTGWTAQHQQPILLGRDAHQDERFYPVPGLAEDNYAAYMTVPIVTSQGELMGVFTMSTVHPLEFPQATLEFVQRVAILIAGLIEKARLYSETQRKLKVLHALAGIGDVAPARGGPQAVLDEIARTAVDVIGADAGAIWAREEGGRVVLQAFHGQGKRQPQPYQVEEEKAARAWACLDGGVATGAVAEMPEPWRSALDRDYRLYAAVGLHYQGQPAGFIVLLRSRSLLFLDDELSLLSTLAAQGALAYDRARLIQQLTEHNWKSDFFNALLSGQHQDPVALLNQGRRFGLDLTRPHAVLVAEVLPGEGATAEEARQEEWLRRVYRALDEGLRQLLPGALSIQRDNGLQAILPVAGGANAPGKKLQELKGRLERAHHCHLAMGLGNTCHDLRDYQRSLEEAREALRIGQVMLWDRSQVMVFEELGIYRYLYKVWVHDGTVRDTQQEMLQRLMDYDRQHGTALMETLEVYLECLGEGAEVAARLFIHRNTLRNRLQKIGHLLGVDVTSKANWFPLYIALKIIKLRVAGQRQAGHLPLAGPAEGEAGRDARGNLVRLRQGER